MFAEVVSLNLKTELFPWTKMMPHTKHKITDSRKSPVSSQNSAKSSKPKQPRGKVLKTKLLSNGFHEVENGVDKRKSPSAEDEIAKMNLLTLRKVDKSVCEIVKTVPHVVLYEFKTGENMWVSAVRFLALLGQGALNRMWCLLPPLAGYSGRVAAV